MRRKICKLYLEVQMGLKLALPMRICQVIILLIAHNLFGQTAEQNLTNHDAQDRYASYAPDGEQIIFESDRDGNWEIYLMNVDGTNPTRLTNDESDDRRPTWHPNGEQILFESNRSGDFALYTLDIAKQEVEKLNVLGLNGTPIFADYSPDGKQIACAIQYSEDHSFIAVINQDGSWKPIIDYGYRTYYPRWSPDGRELVFFSRHDTDNEVDEIYTVHVDKRRVKRLTEWPIHNFCPSWSPRGNQIAYATSYEEGRPEIYFMKPNGKDQTRLTNNEWGDTLPSWSPDGKSLLITAYRNGNYEIVALSLAEL